MPKSKINDYIFYKIVCLDDSCELCYVGSTVNWKARNYSHKRNCTNENSKGYNYKVYKTIRDNGGWCNFKMIELGQGEQLTLRQAQKIEEEYRVELKANLNERRCYITEEQKKEYIQDNRDKIQERLKQYYKKNSDKMQQYSKQYYQDNRDKFLEYFKKYNQVNNQVNNTELVIKNIEVITCVCGCKIQKRILAQHKRTNKHINLMNELVQNK